MADHTPADSVNPRANMDKLWEYRYEGAMLNLRSIVRRGPLRSFDLAHLMLTRIVFPAACVSAFERENAA
jgi:hypothetical protein